MMKVSDESVGSKTDSESFSVSTRATIVIILVAAVAVCGFWIGAWVVGWYPELLLDGKTSQPLADAFGSVNALFAGLAFAGVIYTVYVQIIELRATRIELQHTATANSEMAKSANENVVFNMFQTYCSEYFQTVKDHSMTVMSAGLSSAAYHEYLVSRLVPVRQKNFPHGCWDEIVENNPRFADFHPTEKDFKDHERDKRYKFDELINFFTMLSRQGKAYEVVKSCDFSYSWWRAYMWLIAFDYEERYQQVDNAKDYLTKIDFIGVVRELDKFYGLKSFKSKDDLKKHLGNDDVVKKFNIAPAHRN
ncbi:hypothetical protein IT893_03970 [Thalassospira sp. A40-3]|uniref:hypothetical protein n=1 Tax=Thalassospira sp. A40-3 TaxID=2785908 RepID=UPI0018CE704A|nr:hypothetical protein [Thalassospira sp. A40-3]QPO12687.1 hypothetical protein IT893_03970 [Thalassospira sp. A40-3]